MKKPPTRFRLVPFTVVLVLSLGLLPTDSVLARHGGVHRWTTGAQTYKAVVTSPIPRTRNNTVWAAVPSASASVPLGAGRTALITATFSAESMCTGVGSAYCAVRILIAGIPGEPNQDDGSDFAFDSNGTDLWEAHSATRHLCVRNSLTRTAFATVVVQWRSNGNAIFRLDETALQVERADGCWPFDVVLQ